MKNVGVANGKGTDFTAGPLMCTKTHLICNMKFETNNLSERGRTSRPGLNAQRINQIITNK